MNCKRPFCYEKANHSGWCRPHQKLFIKKVKMYNELFEETPNKLGGSHQKTS